MSAGQLSVPLAVLVARGLLDLEEGRRVHEWLEGEPLPKTFDEIVDGVVEAMAGAR